MVEPGSGAKQGGFPSAALRGAVDLGALAAARDASRQAEERNRRRAQGGLDAPVTVVDATTATFQSDVIDKSFEVPVVVDLWATWCEPCKQLSPVLEALADEADGAWRLAKIDVDAEPEIAVAFGVQSVPSVVAVVKGQRVPLFAGALPQAQVRQYITELLRLAQELGLGAATPAGHAETSPGGQETGDASMQAAQVAAPEGASAAELALTARIEGVNRTAAIANAQAAPQDLAATLLAADVQLHAGDAAAAFARLIEFVRGSAGDDRDQARARLLEMFEIAGTGSPEVAKARAELASALF